MNHPPELPDGLEHVRTTPWFDQDSHPAGLLRNHQVADGVWGRLIVAEGEVGFEFEDDPDGQLTVKAGDSVGIPPTRRHRVVLLGPARFAVEFHKIPESAGVAEGSESTGLQP